MKIRVLLVSWEKVFCEGVAKVLMCNPNIETVDICIDGFKAIQLASELQPKVVFIDEGIKDCGFIEISKRIRELLPHTRIVLIISAYPKYNILSALRAKADVYTDKEITVSGLNAIITQFLESDQFDEIGVNLCPSMAKQLIEEFNLSARSSSESLKENTFGLSKREVEVLTLVAKDKSNKEIAGTLFISENTVKVHLKNIFEKLRLHSRQQVIASMKGKYILPRSDS